MTRPPDDLLTPREVAEIFGVRTTTIARWARAGHLVAYRTPGGHRRYFRQDITALLAGEELSERDLPERGPVDVQVLTADAVRLYEQGWSIRQVAARFGWTYGLTRNLLLKHTTLRARGGPALRPPYHP